MTSCPTFPLELTLSATPRVKRELPARAPVRLQLPSNFPPPLKTPQFPFPLRPSPQEEALTRAHLPDAPRLAATILGGGTDGPNPSTYLASRLPRSPHFRRWSSGEELPIQAHLPVVPRLAAIILGGGADPGPSPLNAPAPRLPPALPTFAGGHPWRKLLTPGR